MFRILCDEILIYDDIAYEDDLKLVDPVLSFEIGAAGSFKVTIPEINRGYYAINRVTSTIIVKHDNDTIWVGRVMQEDIDYWNQRNLVCEGALSFLNDTILEKQSYTYNNGYIPFNSILKQLLTDILAVHNSKVNANRQIECGIIDDSLMDNLFADNNYSWESENETVLNFIQKKVVEQIGGYLSIRYEDNKIYLDYKDFHTKSSEEYPASKQKVEFGKNLISLSRSFNIDDAVSVVIPSGTVSTKIDDQEYKTDVSIKNLDIDDESFQSPQGEPWLKSKYLYNKLGWIEKFEHWDGTEGATEKHYERNAFPGLIWHVGKDIDASNSGSFKDDAYKMSTDPLSQQIEYVELSDDYMIAVHGWSTDYSTYHGVWTGAFWSNDNNQAYWYDIYNTQEGMIELKSFYSHFSNNCCCAISVKRRNNNVITDDDKFNIIFSYYVTATAGQQGNSIFLLEQAKKYLTDHLECLNMNINIEAFDWHYIDEDTPSINVGDIVLVVSAPHDINNEEFLVNSVDIYLDKPENTRFHLGNAIDPRISKMI